MFLDPANSWGGGRGEGCRGYPTLCRVRRGKILVLGGQGMVKWLSIVDHAPWVRWVYRPTLSQAEDTQKGVSGQVTWERESQNRRPRHWHQSWNRLRGTGGESSTAEGEIYKQSAQHVYICGILGKWEPISYRRQSNMTKDTQSIQIKNTQPSQSYFMSINMLVCLQETGRCWVQCWERWALGTKV